MKSREPLNAPIFEVPQPDFVLFYRYGHCHPHFYIGSFNEVLEEANAKAAKDVSFSRCKNMMYELNIFVPRLSNSTSVYVLCESLNSQWNYHVSFCKFFMKVFVQL